MAEIGYYNYYNNEHRISVEKPHDRYKEIVDRYESNKDSLHANNENPYSDENLKMREFETNLSSWADSVRSKCATTDDVYAYVAEKYFGTPYWTYMDRLNLDDKTRAAYDNDLSAILYGTYQNSNMLDPRINWSGQDWQTEETDKKAFNQQAISSQMKNLLAKNDIHLDESSSLLISVNPYDYSTSVSGNVNDVLLSKIKDTLNSDKNSKELFSYMFRNTDNKNEDSVNKYRAHLGVKNLTGYNLSDLTQKDDTFFTNDGQNILDLLKDGISKDNSIGLEFKGVAYEYNAELIQSVAKIGFDKIEDLNLSIGFDNQNGFFITSNVSYDA